MPSSELTAEISDRLENKFFVRVPPEKRPRQFRERTASREKEDKPATVAGGYDLEDTDGVKEKGGEDAEMIDIEGGEAKKPNAIAEQKKGKKGDKVYDSSLFKAIFNVFARRIVISGLLKLISGASPSLAPLTASI